MSIKLALIFGALALVFAVLSIYRSFKESKQAIDSVVDTDYDSAYTEEAIVGTKFTDKCTLLSKECRGNDLWIVFIDENAEMCEELQCVNSEVCINRHA